MFKPTDRPPAYGVAAQLDEPFIDHARTAAHAIRAEQTEPEDEQCLAGGGSAMTWLIEFTDDELTAIYDVIEAAPERQPDAELLLESVLHKITPASVGDPTPAGHARPSDGGLRGGLRRYLNDALTTIRRGRYVAAEAYIMSALSDLNDLDGLSGTASSETDRPS